MSEDNPHVLKALAKTIGKIDKRMAEVAARPTVQTGTITKVALDGKVDFVLDNGKVITGYEAISQHIQEVGRKVLVGMNGDEPVVMLADLIAARSIIADMVLAGTLTAEEITAELVLRVGQSIQSANYVPGVSGFYGDDTGYFEVNDLAARGQFIGIGGPDLLANSNYETGVDLWSTISGSIAAETDPAQIYDGTGALRHVTPASTTEVEAHTAESGAGLMTIDRTLAYVLTRRVKLAAVGDSARVGVRFYDVAGTFLAETIGPPVTGTTAYSEVKCYATPPTSVSGTTTLRPVIDYVIDGLAGFPTDSNLARFFNIDEPGNADTSDFIYTTEAGDLNAPWGNWGTYLCQLNTFAGAFSGKTPTRLRATYTAHCGFTLAYVQPYIDLAGALYFKTPVLLTGETPITFSADWTTDPRTGVAWTAAEIEQFRNGGVNRIGFSMSSTVGLDQQARMDKMEVSVPWVIGTPATKASVRLYTKPATAAGTTARWDAAPGEGLQSISSLDIGRINLRGTDLDPVEIEIARTTWLPVADTFPSTASAVMADMDAANAIWSFNAPASGHVRLRADCTVLDQGASDYYWGLRVASSNVAASRRLVAGPGDRNRVEVEWDVMGLVPGTAYTYKLGHFDQAANATAPWIGPDSGPLILRTIAVVD